MGRLFGTDGIRGIANQEPITLEMGLKLGRAIIRFCQDTGKTPSIVISMLGNRKGLFKKRKAMSRIIAPIILVAVTVTVALGTYWMSDVTSNYMNFEKIIDSLDHTLMTLVMPHSSIVITNP